MNAKKTEEKSKNQRHHFRIEYPPTVRPTLVHKIGACPIIDLSVDGLSFEVDPEYTFLVGEKIQFELKLLSSKQAFKTQARVANVQGTKIGVQFLQELPLSQVRADEIYLASKNLLRAQ